MANQLKRRYCVNDQRLETRLFGIDFPNPVGLAAGFDKEGQWFNQLANLGFGCIEIGTITGQPQPGNPKPRMFRLPADKALINRMGFNSKGCEFAASQLNKKRRSQCVLGINIGKSKVVPLDAAPGEYQKSFQTLFPFADYFTINVSSPNTPGLRELQSRDHLIAIIAAVQETNSRLSANAAIADKPILLKIAPDLTDQQLVEIAEVAGEFSLSGIIATNTTIQRSGLKTSAREIEKIGNGGLSGRPLFQRSLQVVSQLYQQLNGDIPVVGVGGIANGDDAWNMICAGASLVQLYTGFIYGGPNLIHDINRKLIAKIEAAGFASISEAVGGNPIA